MITSLVQTAHSNWLLWSSWAIGIARSNVDTGQETLKESHIVAVAAIRRTVCESSDG
jgi:hypothetical protein